MLIISAQKISTQHYTQKKKKEHKKQKIISCSISLKHNPKTTQKRSNEKMIPCGCWDGDGDRVSAPVIPAPSPSVSLKSGHSRSIAVRLSDSHSLSYSSVTCFVDIAPSLCRRRRPNNRRVMLSCHRFPTLSTSAFWVNRVRQTQIVKNAISLKRCLTYNLVCVLQLFLKKTR